MDENKEMLEVEETKTDEEAWDEIHEFAHDEESLERSSGSGFGIALLLGGIAAVGGAAAFWWQRRKNKKKNQEEVNKADSENENRIVIDGTYEDVDEETDNNSENESED